MSLSKRDGWMSSRCAQHREDRCRARRRNAVAMCETKVCKGLGVRGKYKQHGEGEEAIYGGKKGFIEEKEAHLLEG